MGKLLSRRAWLTGASVGLAASQVQGVPPQNKDKPSFRFALNTATIMGQNLTLAQEIEITAKAGYDGIEPWLSKIEKYAKDGGSLKDIGKRTRDVGLVIPDVIGFFEWIVDDEKRRKKGLEDA